MQPIEYFDRYQQKTCVEQVYGDAYLRWIYTTTTGKLTLETLVKRLWFSRWYGWRMDQPASREKILPFIDQYQLDSGEFANDASEFQTFNEFFFRKLKPEARPVEQASDRVVFPADGRHLCIPDLSQTAGLFVKGEMFDLETLLGDAELSRRYGNGSLLLSRLCPVDYHRFHFPAKGQAGPTRLINGPLYSVNPIALSQDIHILAKNKRTVSILETENVGSVLLLEVGATCVGGICQTYEAGNTVDKGSEKGFFRFGGSSTITLFEPGRIRFDNDLVENSAKQVELYARVGDGMATIL